MSSRYVINLVLVSLILGFYWFLQQPEKASNPHNYQRLTTLSQSEINRIAAEEGLPQCHDDIWQ